MKILVVSSYFPYPLYSGGQVRLFNLLKELSKKHEITLICEKRFRQTITDNDIKVLQKICKKVISVATGRQWSLKNVFYSIKGNDSFLRIGHTNFLLKEEIEKELKENKYDLIHIETFYVMHNLPTTKIPIVLAEHNIEYQVYQRFVDKAPFFMRPFLNIDIAKIKKEEEASWKKADKLIAVSEEDKKVMRDAGASAEVVSNGVDTEKFVFLQRSKIKDQRSKQILFIGDFKWIQNRDSVKFIIEEIWPKIRSKIKDQRSKIQLWVVGRKISTSIKNLTNDPDILFDEKNSELPTEKIFQKADVLLAPIRVGGGTSYKILESMSCGTPVITTKMSADSLGAKDNEDIMASDLSIDLAIKTISLLEDEKLYERISKNGRKLVEQKYTWKSIAEKLNRVYEDVGYKE